MASSSAVRGSFLLIHIISLLRCTSKRDLIKDTPLSDEKSERKMMKKTTIVPNGIRICELKVFSR